MKILDWYIIRKFLSTYVFAILAMTLIIVVFDTSQKIDDFVSKQAPLQAIILDYYANFVPELCIQFSSLFAFVAVIFFTSKMASHTEIVAMLSTGISMGRIMRPYMIVAVFIAAGNCYLANFVLPPSSATRYNFEAQYIRNPYQNRDRHIHRQIHPGEFVYIESFNVRSQTAYNFALESTSGNELRSKFTSSDARWDTAKQRWHVSRYVVRNFSDSCETLQFGTDIDTSITLTGHDLSVRTANIIGTMGLRDLNRYIETLEMQGASATLINEALLAKHRRWAYPMASIILTIIGVALSSRKMRGGMGLHIGLGVGLSFAYILFQRFSEMFVQSGVLTPGIALWIPNFLFMAIAITLYRYAPK